MEETQLKTGDEAQRISWLGFHTGTCEDPPRLGKLEAVVNTADTPLITCGLSTTGQVLVGLLVRGTGQSRFQQHVAIFLLSMTRQAHQDVATLAIGAA